MYVIIAMATLRSTKPSIKSQAAKLVRGLSNAASWEDLMYQIYVRQKIECGLSDIQAGRTHSHEGIKKAFGISS